MKKMILLAAAFCLLMAGCSTTETGTTTDGAVAEVTGTIEGTLTVQGACGMCKTRIEEAALEVNGVTGAEWEQDTKLLTLKFYSGSATLDTISEAVAGAGHDTDRHRADDEVYAAMPECCLYRDSQGHDH